MILICLVVFYFSLLALWLCIDLPNFLGLLCNFHQFATQGPATPGRPLLSIQQSVTATVLCDMTRGAQHFPVASPLTVIAVEQKGIQKECRKHAMVCSATLLATANLRIYPLLCSPFAGHDVVCFHTLCTASSFKGLQGCFLDAEGHLVGQKLEANEIHPRGSRICIVTSPH